MLVLAPPASTLPEILPINVSAVTLPENTAPDPLILPVMFAYPEATILPAVVRFPVALTNPAANRFPPVMLPVATT